MDSLYNLSKGSNTSIAYMGDKDSLELLLPDFQQYATGMDLCFTKIAMCTGFPLSYIKGIGVGGLNADGSGERVQTDLALYSFAKQYIVPLLQEILKRFGLKAEVNVKKPLSVRLDDGIALREAIQAIEFTNLLTDEQKKQYIKQYIDDLM